MARPQRAAAQQDLNYNEDENPSSGLEQLTDMIMMEAEIGEDTSHGDSDDEDHSAGSDDENSDDRPADTERLYYDPDKEEDEDKYEMVNDDVSKLQEGLNTLKNMTFKNAFDKKLIATSKKYSKMWTVSQASSLKRVFNLDMWLRRFQ